MSTPIALRRARLSQAAAAAMQAAAPAADELAITGFEVFPLREPTTGRAYAITKVATRSGLIGYGECALPSEPSVNAARERLRNRSATAYEAIDALLERAGPVRAGVNIALLDILGKSSKAPLYQVLGGPTRNRARAFRRLTGESDDALLGSLEAARGEGFRAFGVPLPPLSARNHGMALARACRLRLEALIARGGDDSDFILLGDGRLSPGDAAMIARECEPLRLLWFDEPCPRESLAAVAKIAEAAVVPLGFGEGLERGAPLQDLLRHDCVDLVRPSLNQVGISGIRRMAALAETYYVAMAPAHDGGPLGTAAALHLAASLPHFFIQEVPPATGEARRMRAAIAPAALEQPAQGYLALPAGPGLGVSVNEQALPAWRGGFA